MTYYEDMSKIKANLLYIFVICIMLFTANFFAFQNKVCLAESASFRVCVSDCAIFASPNSSLTDNILEIKSYNEILKINDTLIDDLADSSNLKFYEVLDADNNITVFVSLLVKEEAIIKELSANIQNKIKETVKRSTDLDVNQININIKNIENQKNSIKNENQTKIKINNVQVNQNQTKENQTETNIVK